MKNHYDVLSLHRNCSSQEIKSAFINLSKIYHPDKNKNFDAHKKFLQINEAYSVLGKPESRRIYDQNLSFHEFRGRSVDTFARNNVQRPTSYEEMCMKYKQQYYYQHEAVPRATIFTGRNIAAALFCCLLIAMGSAMEMRAMKKRRDYHSHIAGLMLLRSKERARALGRQKVREMLANGTLEPIKFSDVAKEYEAKMKKK